MLELVGSEEKDTKVKVTVEIDNDGDVAIRYDGILVLYLQEHDGTAYCNGLRTQDQNALHAKGISMENGRIKVLK